MFRRGRWEVGQACTSNGFQEEEKARGGVARCAPSIESEIWEKPLTRWRCLARSTSFGYFHFSLLTFTSHFSLSLSLFTSHFSLLTFTSHFHFSLLTFTSRFSLSLLTFTFHFSLSLSLSLLTFSLLTFVEVPTIFSIPRHLIFMHVSIFSASKRSPLLDLAVCPSSTCTNPPGPSPRLPTLSLPKIRCTGPTIAWQDILKRMLSLGAYPLEGGGGGESVEGKVTLVHVS